ncbi:MULTISPECIES: HNH endonuclease family protein [Gordonia]|uniref:HNH endonuclease family protein n=2 Tax=Gordoniaceae TaxID=85026 RepID=UPI0009DA625B|nr:MULTISPECIES: HNH endonuclease family protein [Gordonia]AUH69782.1 HNH endonuclease [Gordonia sp. YC-JH1]MBY4571536.1 HNH endonuclease [Gordonia sihwensis]WFN94898.1 HNH endonuclease family protein [Gordonia sihwensis]
MTRRPRRTALAVASGALVAGLVSGCSLPAPAAQAPATPSVTRSHVPVPVSPSGAVEPETQAPAPVGTARAGLARLAVKGRAPKTGYARAEFGPAWTDDQTAAWGRNGLSTREDILSRDLTDVTCKVRGTSPRVPPCVVQSGTLHDPYTGSVVEFVRGNKTSALVPIDHVVSLGDGWQKGAQQLSRAERIAFSNDPLNLIASTRAPNSAKSDSDAASWLVPNKSFRCAYVARQVAVKLKYRLWVTGAEKDAISRVLEKCPDQPLPTESDAVRRTYG